jgi:guanosine-3',5'-bis(diphosphate) 3'-pyrophosphohydrolase
MAPTPLRPPSLHDSEEAATPSSWPSVFDAPATVDRVWTDFVAEHPDEERKALQRALAFARAHHGTQTRRGSDTPYWVHLVRVAMELARWGVATPTLMQGALLHDTVEDTRATVEEIRAGFGDEVAEIVHWLTCPRGDEAELREYYGRLAAEAPLPVRLLKLADRVDNLRSIQALVMRTGERHRRWAGNYLARTVWQVLPLAAAAPSTARVDLLTAMADLAPLVAPEDGEGGASATGAGSGRPAARWP